MKPLIEVNNETTEDGRMKVQVKADGVPVLDLFGCYLLVHPMDDSLNVMSMETGKLIGEVNQDIIEENQSIEFNTNYDL